NGRRVRDIFGGKFLSLAETVTRGHAEPPAQSACVNEPKALCAALLFADEFGYFAAHRIKRHLRQADAAAERSVKKYVRFDRRSVVQNAFDAKFEPRTFRHPRAVFGDGEIVDRDRFAEIDLRAFECDGVRPSLIFGLRGVRSAETRLRIDIELEAEPRADGKIAACADEPRIIDAVNEYDAFANAPFVDGLCRKLRKIFAAVADVDR